MCDHHTPSSDQKNRYGSALEHGQAHERDHARWSRRHFLRTIGAAGSVSLLLGRLPVTALAASPLAFALNDSDSDHILVLIRLKGGNDGLNMIIPVFDYGTYNALRPRIAVPRNQIIDLDASFGMPTTMQPLRQMWLDGRMHVVNSVGYPEQNLSHFRSADIWASASDSDEVVDSGWLGRYLDGEYPDFLTSPPSTPPAIQIGGSGNLLFTNEDGVDMGVIVNNPEELAEIARIGALYDPNDVPGCYYGEQLSYLRSIANSTFRYAQIIADSYDAGANAVEYRNPLGQQLALVARLIKGGLNTRLYMVNLDGFDTHARQNEIHPRLLNYLADAVVTFFADLNAGGQAGRVLTMTHSEFGRRPQGNASEGCDHGAAAPLLLFGPGLSGNGFAGPAPDLRNFDKDGNLRFGVDFRQVYATVLEGWLCVPGATVDSVLGGRFDRLTGLGLNCALTAIPMVENRPSIRHWVSYAPGQMVIHYALPEAAPVRVEVFNMLGQPVATLRNEYQMSGEHQAVFQPSFGFAAGNYVYRIKAGRQVGSGKMILGGK